MEIVCPFFLFEFEFNSCQFDLIDFEKLMLVSETFLI